MYVLLIFSAWTYEHDQVKFKGPVMMTMMISHLAAPQCSLEDEHQYILSSIQQQIQDDSNLFQPGS
jgi:hypothetical protein